MRRINYAGESYLVSDRFADALVGHLHNRFESGDLRPLFYSLHYYAPGATVALDLRAEVLITPSVPLTVTAASDYYENWDEPHGTADELYFLTAWKGEAAAFQGD